MPTPKENALDALGQAALALKRIGSEAQRVQAAALVQYALEEVLLIQELRKPRKAKKAAAP